MGNACSLCVAMQSLQLYLTKALKTLPSLSNMTLVYPLCAEVKGILSGQQYMWVACSMHGRGVNLPRPSGQIPYIIYQRFISSSFLVLLFPVTSRFFPPQPS